MLSVRLLSQTERPPAGQLSRQLTDQSCTVAALDCSFMQGERIRYLGQVGMSGHRARPGHTHRDRGAKEAHLATEATEEGCAASSSAERTACLRMQQLAAARRARTSLPRGRSSATAAWHGRASALARFCMSASSPASKHSAGLLFCRLLLIGILALAPETKRSR